jgi:uncharacterized protein (TIRG00374 family)
MPPEVRIPPLELHRGCPDGNGLFSHSISGRAVHLSRLDGSADGHILAPTSRGMNFAQRSKPRGGREPVIGKHSLVEEGPDRHPEVSSQEWSRRLVGAGGIALLVAVALLLARFPAFEFALRIATGVLSADGTVSQEHRAEFAKLLLAAAGIAAAAGSLLIVLSIPRWRRTFVAAVRWDALHSLNLAMPNPFLVLASATLSGLLPIGLWLQRGRLGPFIQHLFAKEGPFEDVTFILELAAALLCFAAAWRWSIRDPRSMRLATVLYAALGLLLFFVGMEEINWGQTLFGFATPEGWSQVNYQHETSIHNLVDKSALTETWKLVAVAFGIGVLAIVFLSARFPRTIVGAIAPHPTLVPLALCASYAGVRLHPELIELLISVFFAFYSYRIWVAARSTRMTVSTTPGITWAQARRPIQYAVAGLLIAVLLYRLDWARAERELAMLSLWTFASAFTAMCIGLVISAWKWDWALRLHDLRYPYPFVLRSLCIGFFFNNFLPTAVGGDGYRVLRTLPHDSYRSRALSAVIVERGMGFLALIILGTVGAMRLAGHHALAHQYLYILLTLALFGIGAFIALQRGWLQRLAHRWQGIPALNSVHHNIGLLRSRQGEWLGLIAGSFAFQLVSIGVIFLLLNGLGANATPSQCALIAAAVGVAAALPISVNGVGVMEGAMVAAAVALTIDYEQALIAAFARRVLAVCLAVPCGALWLTETRQQNAAAGHTSFVSFLQTLRRDGFRGAVNTLKPRAPHPWSLAATDSVLMEPDAPLAEPADVEPMWSDTQLLEYTHDAIIIWEMHGQGILYWNRAAEQLYGYSRNEVHGRTTHELLKTELVGGVTRLENSLARFGIWAGELHHTTRSGRKVDVEGRLAVMSQHNGRWLVLEVNRDITDKKVAEAARRSMEHQLAELRTLRHASRG